MSWWTFRAAVSNIELSVLKKSEISDAFHVLNWLNDAETSVSMSTILSTLKLLWLGSQFPNERTNIVNIGSQSTSKCKISVCFCLNIIMQKPTFISPVRVLCRCVEGPGCPYHHDRYSDRPAVVHLRLRQGVLPPAPPPSPWDARVPEEEAWPGRLKHCPFPLSRSVRLTHQPPQLPQRTRQFSIFMSSAHPARHRAQSCYYSCIFKNSKKCKERRWRCRSCPSKSLTGNIPL